VAVPPGSILLCVALGSTADTIAAELLVRALREQGLDARHVSLEDLDVESRPPGADPAAIAIAYVVSAFPSAEREHSERTIDRVRQHLPNARVVSMFLPGISIPEELPPRSGNSDHAVSSFVEAAEMCLGQRACPIVQPADESIRVTAMKTSARTLALIAGRSRPQPFFAADYPDARSTV
jgi:hypothetical protein